MNNDLIILATEENAETISEIFSALYKPKPRWSENRIKWQINNKKLEYYLLSSYQGILLGAIALAFKRDQCELEAIAVKEEVQRKGIGTKLLGFAENLARKRQCEAIWCHSLEVYQLKAKGFYEKNGWERDDPSTTQFFGMKCYKFEKELK